MQRSALFSNCKKYRYLLGREWDINKPKILFIGLNPSTADEYKDDPTILRCIQFAKSWGYGSLKIANIFAYRATDPNVLLKEKEPIGKDNNEHIITSDKECNKTVIAWGNHGLFLNRAADVLPLIQDPYCIKKNSNGTPSHPLYLPKKLTPFKYIN